MKKEPVDGHRMWQPYEGGEYDETEFTCPSCHQKRALLTAMHVAEEVCFPVAHRQVVLTIPKRLRLHPRFDRQLLGKLSSCAWTCLRAEVQRLLGRDDVLPGMVVAIQTHGELLHWHPHIHALVTCGAFAPEGDFLKVPEFDMDRLQAAWQEAVFALYLAEFTQHIPPKGAHLIRYYGWYSNKARGMRRMAAEAAATTPLPVRSRCSQTWAMLIKRVYEIDPLACPRCGGEMTVIAFIEAPQGAVIEKILRGHQSVAMVGGLWNPSTPRAPPACWRRSLSPAADDFSDSPTESSDEPRERTYVDIDTFEATF